MEGDDVSTILKKLRCVHDGRDFEMLKSNDTKLAVLDELKKVWLAPLDKNVIHDSLIRFEFATDDTVTEMYETLSEKEIDDTYRKYLFLWDRLKIQFHHSGLLQQNDGVLCDISGDALCKDLDSIKAVFRRCRDVLLADIRLRKALDPSIDSGCPNISDRFGYVPIDIWPKAGEREELILFLLQHLFEAGLRRQHDACYRQVMSPYLKQEDGSFKKFPTHAWERVCDIKDFVQGCVSKDDSYKQWKAMIAPNALEGVVKYLSGCNENEFKELYPDRHWHSFHNGIYSTSNSSFYCWGDDRIPPGVVSCKYHDQIFDTSIFDIEESYYIPTPCFDKILEYQLCGVKGMSGNTEEEIAARVQIKAWVYAMLGRLLFEVNEKDGWQVIPFFVGKAGTGKSLLLKTAGWFFQDEDVETMSNKGRKEFNLESFLNKLLWRCYEVKGDFRLDQAQFQSMVSGEPTQIDRLYKSSLSVVWKIPGILAGNEPGGWIDNSGSISRRILLFYADRRVHEKDPHLDKKIKMEMGNLIHKCCSSYLGAVDAYGHLDIWETYTDEDGVKRNILPQFFHDNKKRLQELTHPLVSFLRNEQKIIVVADDKSAFTNDDGELKIKNMDDIGMPFARFQELANLYFEANKLKFGWKADKYKSTFDEVGIKKVRFDKDCKYFTDRKAVRYGGIDYGEGTEWLFGVTEREENSWADAIANTF